MLPSNIRKYLRGCGSEQQDAVKTISRWCDKLKHPIVGGTAIGKYYDTLVLDLTYNGSQIYVNESGFGKTELGYDGVTINNVGIPDGSASSFRKFKAEVERIFPPNGQNNTRTASSRRVAFKEWMGGTTCDICRKPITGYLYDAMTESGFGSWGTMCKRCWQREGAHLGVGQGQEFVEVEPDKFQLNRGGIGMGSRNNHLKPCRK